MRILFVSNYYPPKSLGGYEESCFEIAGCLREKGHRVDVLTSRPGDQSDGPHVHRLLAIRPALKHLRPLRVVEYVREALSCESANASGFAETVGNLQPDVVMCWNGSRLGARIIAIAEEVSRPIYYVKDTWMLPLLARRHRLRSWDGNPLKAIYYAWSRYSSAHLARIEAERLVFVSSSLRSEYRRAGVDVAGSTVIGNGISASSFPARPPHILARTPGQAHKILYCGRIVPEKGLITLVRALAKVRSQRDFRETKLTVLGPAQDQAFLVGVNQIIRDLGLTQAVKFVPHQPRLQLSTAYASHDVLVFPSEWEEPFGLSLLEAMATGLPVVASLRGAPAEIVRDGLNGFTFAPADSNDLANKLLRLFGSPTEAALTGLRASDEVHSSRRLESQADSIEETLVRAFGPTTNGSWARASRIPQC